MVLHAGSQTDPPGPALSELCEAYWRPLYAFLRHDGWSQPDAEDAVQGFFTSLLSGTGVVGADPQRGRFRSYLLGALRHYLSNQRAKQRAVKRGGGSLPLSLDSDAFERGEHQSLVTGAGAPTPESAYARAWAQEVTQRARDRLREAYTHRGKAPLLVALEPFLISAKPPSYNEVAVALQMNEANVRVAVHRLRKRFGAELRAEVAETLADPSKIDEELREILRACSAAS